MHIKVRIPKEVNSMGYKAQAYAVDADGIEHELWGITDMELGFATEGLVQLHMTAHVKDIDYLIEEGSE